MGRRIEGCFRKGESVIVVEDVITTGGSALSAIEAILAVVDREEGGRDAIEVAGYPVRSFVSVSDLGVASTRG